MEASADATWRRAVATARRTYSRPVGDDADIIGLRALFARPSGRRASRRPFDAEASGAWSMAPGAGVPTRYIRPVEREGGDDLAQRARERPA